VDLSLIQFPVKETDAHRGLRHHNSAMVGFVEENDLYRVMYGSTATWLELIARGHQVAIVVIYELGVLVGYLRNKKENVPLP
jgi:hypothetical protein